jgi:hypothetical protein
MDCGGDVVDNLLGNGVMVSAWHRQRKSADNTVQRRRSNASRLSQCCRPAYLPRPQQFDPNGCKMKDAPTVNLPLRFQIATRT